MSDTTFSTATVTDTESKDTEIEILRDGDCVGVIRKETRNAATGASRDWYPRWVAYSYEVDFFIEGVTEECFEVDDYAHPRTALAAAKRYVRETLNREGA